jgi:hypothetical protein
MSRFLLYYLLLGISLSACQTNRSTGEESIESSTIAEEDNPIDEYSPQLIGNVSSNEYYGEEANSESYVPLRKQTRVRFENFTIVFYDFNGYIRDDSTYLLQFGGYTNYQKSEAVFNDSEKDSANYQETLIVLKDTLSLSEMLFDDRINNTLIQVIPVHQADFFKISFCYLGVLGEVIDFRGLSEEETNKRYANALYYKEQTRFYPIRDSAKWYFRALPHTPDMVQVTVKDGQVVPVTSNTPEQLELEKKLFMEDFERIKKKYGMHDTVFRIDMEEDVVAYLTKNKRLFSYGHNYYLFKIERYEKNSLSETKYVVISISYGC